MRVARSRPRDSYRRRRGLRKKAADEGVEKVICRCSWEDLEGERTERWRAAGSWRMGCGDVWMSKTEVGVASSRGGGENEEQARESVGCVIL